ncbi:glycosyltransferase family 4 protein [soil metagenome]
MRIGLVCPYSLSIPGGVQAQVMGLARAMRSSGHEARVLGPCDGPPPASFVTPLGASLPLSANGSIAPLAPDPPCVLRTIRALRDEQFDVLCVHEPLAPGPSITTSVMHPAPVIATFHAAGRSTGYRVFRPLLVRILENLDAKVAVSKDAAELVRSHLGGEFRIAFNGVEIDRIRSIPPHRNDHPTILFCGRHEERKGLAVLLAALERLAPDVRCQVASDGPGTAHLMQQFGSDERITWLGRISEDDKLARLAGASVFCAPSLHGESFGVVLVEAMAAGTPVVASALDGYRNVVTDGVDALLTPPGDVDALAGALRRVLEEPGTAGALAAAGSRRAEHFSMTVLAEMYLEMSRQLVA